MVREYEKLSVVIPCFNEIKTLRDVISKVANSPIGIALEIIVIDDFSTDGSRELIEELYRDRKIDLPIFLDKNSGKGAAVRAGFEVASGSIVLVQDADLECNPDEYPSLLEPILNKNADVVYGSRYTHRNPRPVESFHRQSANKFLTLVSNIFSNLTLTDMETCYKVFRKEVIQSIELRENRFGFEPEVTARISRLPIKIVEVSVSYSPRTVEQGKKIGLRDGFRALYVILKYNTWGARN